MKSAKQKLSKNLYDIRQYEYMNFQRIVILKSYTIII